MTTALVTGGAGFIGFHLAKRLLEEGWALVLVDDLSRGADDAALRSLVAAPGVTLLGRDLTDPHALDDIGNDIDVVFHFAAIVGVANVIARAHEVLRVNAASLMTALEFARRLGGLRRFVFASSSEVYAGSAAEGAVPIPTPEDVPLRLPALASPRNAYLLSKIHGEVMCHHAGVPLTILRPHNVYGPRMGLAHVIPELMERAHHTDAPGVLEVASVAHRRGFCFIDDAVEQIRLVAESPECAGQVMNVGNGEAEVDMGTLAAMVIEVVGHGLEIVTLPPTPGSPERRCPDMTKTVGMAGYRARAGLDEGLRRTYEWYRRHVFEAEVEHAR